MVDLELENWQLKAALLQTQQQLMVYQAREVQENLARLAAQRKQPEAPPNGPT